MPERFSWVLDGKIAGMERPGSLFDLEEDLMFLRHAGIDVIVNLQEKEHFQDLGGFVVKNIPIDDFEPPMHSDFEEFNSYVTPHIDNGKRVLVHCRAGMGRTNIMLASFLLHHLGIDPDTALDTVRIRRPVHFVTFKQEEALKEYFKAVKDSILPHSLSNK